MDSASIDLLTQKLKNAPQNVLERVIGYIDALVEPIPAKPYTLSEEQKKQLLKQNDVPLDQCIDAEDVYQQLKQKHGL